MTRPTIHLTALLTTAILALTGCGAAVHPATAGLSIEGKAAVAGRQVVVAVKTAADGVDQLITQQIIPQAEGVLVLRQLRDVSATTSQLAQALTIVDQAKDAIAKQAALGKVGEIVKALQRGVSQAIVPVGSQAGRARVATVLALIGDALVDMNTMLVAAGGKP